MADGLHALEDVSLGVRVGAVEEALVAGALGAGLRGVDAGDDDETILDVLRELCQARDVLEHGILAVRGARADDEELARILAGDDASDLLVKGDLLGGELRGEGHTLANLLRDGQATLEVHRHG